MNKNNDKQLSAVVFTLLKPLVRLLLRHGMPFREFSELARRAYMDVATEEFTLPGRKQTTSRISVLTGINRKDIARLQQQTHPLENDNSRQQSRASRVINGWLRDARYHTQSSVPAPLPLEASDQQSGLPSFSELVRSYSGDVPTRAMLDELLRTRQVAVDGKGQVVLQTEGYLPQHDQGEQYRIFATAVADLVKTVDFNLDASHEQTRFQRCVAYRRIPAEVVQQIRSRSERELNELLLHINQWLSQYSKDVGESHVDETGVDETGVDGSGLDDEYFRVGVGFYYFEDAPETAGKAKKSRR